MDNFRSLRAGQFGVNPFDRKEIIIGATTGAPDRSQGVLIPELEGNAFYIERCDWPVLMNIGSQGGGLNTSVNARDGLQFTGNFRGITLTHPPINVPALLSIFLFKEDGFYTNQLDNPVCRLPISSRAVTATGTSQVQGIIIPPGVRSIKNLQAYMLTATTISPGYATAQFYDKTATFMPSPTNLTQNVGGTLFTYNQSNATSPALIQGAVGTGLVASFPNIFIPTNAAELQVAFAGTGLTALNLYGNFE